MFKEIGSVCLFVKNQDRAKEFYTKVLGFELRTDQPIYPGATNRWLAVAPPGAKTEVILYLPDENWKHYRSVVGKSQALTFNVGDIQSLYARLLEKGVKFTQPPDVQPWGTFITLVDSEENKIILVEQPK